jgi:hypothetical protein
VLSNLTTFSFLGPRVGCVVYQPLYGVDLAAACLKK